MFFELWHPEVLLFCILLAWAYWRLTEPYAADAAHPRRRLLFHLGLLAFYISEGTPVHLLSENYLASVHMLQHSLQTLVLPPLALLGLPPELLERATAPLRRRGWGRALLAPVTGLASFNLFYAAGHVPAVMNLVLEYTWIHMLQHFLFIIFAFLFWLPLVSPLPSLRLNDGPRMLYLFVHIVFGMVSFGPIFMMDTIIYTKYESAPRLAVGLGPLADQQYALFVMNVLSMVIFTPMLISSFLRKFRAETDRAPVFPESGGSQS